MKLRIDQIELRKRRKVDSAAVKNLAESIKEVGLLNPIHFYTDGDDPDGTPILAAGAHRLEAVKLLGESEIDAKRVPAPNAELIELDENLQRNEFTALERSRAVKRRMDIAKKRLIEMQKKTPITKTRPLKTGITPASKETAEIMGLNERQVRSIARRAELISEDVQEAIADMPVADSGAELDALSSLTPDEQRQAVERVKSGADSNFREARDFIRGGTPTDEKRVKHLDRLRRAWLGTTDDVRTAFLAEIANWRPMQAAK